MTSSIPIQISDNEYKTTLRLLSNDFTQLVRSSTRETVELKNERVRKIIKIYEHVNMYIRYVYENGNIYSKEKGNRSMKNIAKKAHELMKSANSPININCIQDELYKKLHETLKKSISIIDECLCIRD